MGTVDETRGYGLESGHQLVSEKKDKSSYYGSYITRSYLFSPFTPFIVLFGTVIAYKSEEDLRLMEVSVQTLQAAAQYSSGVGKLHKACETFLNLAKSYIAQTARQVESQEAFLRRQQQQQQQQHQQQQQPLITETFDPTGFYGQDWDAMLDEWDLGLGGENAREMSSFLTSSYLS